MKTRSASRSCFSRLASSVGLACGILAASLVTGCKPPGASDDNDSGSSGNPSPAFGSLQFNLPAKGTTLNGPVTVSVAGKNISKAVFEVDSDVASEVAAAPFEWTFDPAVERLGKHVIGITVENPAGAQESSRSEIVVTRPPLPVDELQQQIALLPPSHWLEVPYSHLRDVAYSVADDYKGDIRDVMTAASGAAFDTQREQLLVFGGGQSYAGNEIYAFNMTELKWFRLTEPSEFPPGDENNSSRQVIHPDGSPVSRHTYDTIAYLPAIDSLFVGGGVAVYPLGDLADNHTYLLDLSTLKWHVKAASCPSVAYGSVCAAAPDGLVWMQGGGNTRNAFAAYDPVADSWTSHGAYPGWYPYYSTAEVDPVRNKLVAVGNDATIVWDLAKPDDDPIQLATTGDKEIEGGQSPGLAYHPGSGKLVAWDGGDAVYTLDLESRVWTRIPSTGLVEPGPANTRGTFGRWAYVPSKEVFIVANEVDRNVFLYRLP